MLRGTAGALRLAAEESLLEDRFLVLYGDSWLQVAPSAVADAHVASGLPALMTVFENYGRWDQSNVVVSGDRVTTYEKGALQRTADMRWIDYGLSILTRALVQEISGDDPQDLAPVLSELARTGRLAAFEATERFYEIGSPDGLAELEARLGLSGRARLTDAAEDELGDRPSVRLGDVEATAGVPAPLQTAAHAHRDLRS